MIQQGIGEFYFFWNDGDDVSRDQWIDCISTLWGDMEHIARQIFCSTHFNFLLRLSQTKCVESEFSEVATIL